MDIPEKQKVKYIGRATPRAFEDKPVRIKGAPLQSTKGDRNWWSVSFSHLSLLARIKAKVLKNEKLVRQVTDALHQLSLTAIKIEALSLPTSARLSWHKALAKAESYSQQQLRNMAAAAERNCHEASRIITFRNLQEFTVWAHNTANLGNRHNMVKPKPFQKHE